MDTYESPKASSPTSAANSVMSTAMSSAKSAMTESLPKSMSSLTESLPSMPKSMSSFTESLPKSLPKSMSSLAALPIAAAASLSSAAQSSLSSAAAKNNYPFVRYTFILLILIFLGFNLFLYLEKPKNKGLYKFYEPILTKFTWGRKILKHEQRDEEKKEREAALVKLNATLEKERKAEKNIANKIDDTSNKSKIKLMKKREVVLPVADDSTSLTQTSKSKAGFCYIGEDRGFRSCIEVGEGEVCMSGDIFPTQDVCINPNLRA